jgi:hypothetical protein
MLESTCLIDGAGARAAREDYELGLVFYGRKQWTTAARHFATAERKCGCDDINRHLYLSYQGLCLVYSGDVSGLNLCRRSAAMETVRSGIFLNLALAELKLNFRKRAHRAISVGLDINPTDAELLELRQKMGVRRPPILPFLSRENLLNRWLGSYTYQRLQTAR